MQRIILVKKGGVSMDKTQTNNRQIAISMGVAFGLLVVSLLALLRIG